MGKCNEAEICKANKIYLYCQHMWTIHHSFSESQLCLKAMADIVMKYLSQNSFVTKYLGSSGTCICVVASLSVKCNMKFTFMIKTRKYNSRQNWNHYFRLDIKLNILTKIICKSQDQEEKCCQANNLKTSSTLCN